MIDEFDIESGWIEESELGDLEFVNRATPPYPPQITRSATKLAVPPHSSESDAELRPISLDDDFSIINFLKQQLSTETLSSDMIRTALSHLFQLTASSSLKLDYQHIWGYLCSKPALRISGVVVRDLCLATLRDPQSSLAAEIRNFLLSVVEALDEVSIFGPQSGRSRSESAPEGCATVELRFNFSGKHGTVAIPSADCWVIESKHSDRSFIVFLFVCF